MCGRERYAVSDVIALILVFAIMTSTISFVMFWGVPYMEEKKTEARAESALTQFSTISDIIKDDVIAQGSNSSTVVDFVTDADYVSLDSKGERFVLYYSLDQGFDFNVSGFDDDDDTKFTFTPNTGNPTDYLMEIDLLYDDFLNPGDKQPAGDWTVTIGNGNFADAVQINVTHTVNGLVGRIWLFDTGSITYTTVFSTGIYNVIAENGGVVYARDNNGYLSNKPNIYDRDGLLVMRIIQLKSGSISGSGKAKYQFTIELNNSFIRANKASIPECFKMQIHGSKAAVTAWKIYFGLEHSFSQYAEGFAEGTLYLDGNRDFTLTHSVCDVTMRIET